MKMKHAVRTQAELKASPKAVFSVLTDFARYSQWNTLVPRIDGVAELGARITLHIRIPGLPHMRLPATIDTYRPHEEISWIGAVPGTAWLSRGRHYHRLQAQGYGTVFNHGEEFAGLLMPLQWWYLAPVLHRGYEQLNTQLAKRLDQI